MTPEQAILARHGDVELLLAEALQATRGWAYLTVHGMRLATGDDLDRYRKVLDAFRTVAAGRLWRSYPSGCGRIFAVQGEEGVFSTRSEDADWVIGELYGVVMGLAPQGRGRGRGWEIRGCAA